LSFPLRSTSADSMIAIQLFQGGKWENTKKRRKQPF
jgi:hypothetical protein